MPTPTLLLASDLDGTLIFNRTVGAADAAALAAWRAAGHLAVCATGKSVHATQHALAGQQVTFDYYVLYTGAVVTDANYQILQESHLPPDLVDKILSHLQGVPNIAVFATTMAGPDRALMSTVPASAHTDIIQTFRPLPLAEIHQHQFVGIPIWVAGSQADIDNLIASLSRCCGARADIHQNQDFIDIVPAGATKATGLSWLIEHLAGTGQQVRCFTLGDSFNDLDMHRMADHSASFPHSPLPVQQATTVVTPSAADYITSLLEMHA